MDKDYILKHVDELSAQQLFDAINQGKVTLKELRDTHKLDRTKREAIIALQKEHDSDDDIAWNSMRQTERGCREYLTKYPEGKHKDEAWQNIQNYEQQRQQQNDNRNKIIEKLKKHPNSFSPGMLRAYLDNNTISEIDIENAGIPSEIISSLDNIVIPQYQPGKTPDYIPDGYTEVYFWGVPGSGKTCALAAVLSAADKEGYLEIAQGPGYDYAIRLKNIFSNKISFLPGPSPVDTTQYLPFALKKPRERHFRSVSLIELSGEIFQCFLYKNANKPLPSSQHEDTFNSLVSFLNGDNRKIHFFFVDYDLENNPDADGYRQSDYLNAAATFFNDKQNNFFRKSTDSIYIVLTKSDLIAEDKNERLNKLSDYLKNNHFLSFVNSLRAKCIENSINGKKILGINFALGKVFFRQICMFDSEAANNIIDILIRRIAPKRTSILDVFNK